MANEHLAIAFPGTAAGSAELVLSDGDDWLLTGLEMPPAARKSMLVGGSGVDGSLPVGVSRRENGQVSLRLEMVPQADVDSAFDLIGELERALVEAERVASAGEWVDPGLDFVRLVWQPAGSDRVLVRPVLGGELDVPRVVSGDDAGLFLDSPAPVVKVSLDVDPCWFGDRVELVAATGSDSFRFGDNSAVVFDVPAAGGDVSPWVDLLLVEDDAQPRQNVLVRAESPKTGDAEFVAASGLVTAGYAGALSSGAVSLNSSEWQYMCEIPAQSHSRPRVLTLVHATGGGKVRVQWREGGTARSTPVVDLPSFGVADVPLGLVSGDWSAVIEVLGSASIRGVRFDGADGYANAQSGLPVGLGVRGMTVLEDDLLGSGSLGGKGFDIGSGTWVTSGATTDFTLGATGAQRTTTADTSARIALAGTGSYSWVWVGVEAAHTAGTVPSSWPVGSGLICRYVNTSNMVAALTYRVGTSQYMVLYRVLGGVATFLAGHEIPVDGARMEVAIDELGRWEFRTWRTVWGSPGAPWVSEARSTGQDMHLSSIGTLGSGRVGIYDRWSGAANGRLIRAFGVKDTPWRADPLMLAGDEVRLAGASMLHDSGGEVPFRGSGLVGLSPVDVSRLYVAAKRGRDAAANAAANETDNLELSVHARARFLSVPT